MGHKVSRHYKGHGPITGHEGDRPKDRVYSSHRACFTDKKSYEKLPFTERQIKIINGQPTESPIKRNDVVVVMRKAESLGQYEIAEKVYDLYGHLFHEFHDGDPTQEEAAAILDSLTPDDLK